MADVALRVYCRRDEFCCRAIRLLNLDHVLPGLGSVVDMRPNVRRRWSKFRRNRPSRIGH